MADNTTIKDADDVVVPIATDDVGGVAFQRVKLDVGGDGVSVPVVGALPVSASALPLPTGAATGINQDTTNSRLATLIQQTDAVEASLTAIDTDLGALDSAPAPADGSGNYSLNGAAKRLVTSLATLLARVPVIGKQAAGASMPVTIADSDLQDISITGPANQKGDVFNAFSENGLGWTDCIGVQHVTMTLVTAAGTLGGSLVFFGTNDPNATTGIGIPILRMDGTVNPATAAPTWSLANPGTHNLLIPTPFRYLRAGIAGATGTSLGIQLFARLMRQPFPAWNNQQHNVVALLTNSQNRIGLVNVAYTNYDDSITALAANAVFTGVARDCQATNAHFEEVVVSCEQDVGFTLALEVSRNGTTWARAKTMASAAVVGGGQYAEIVHAPSWRWWRVVVLNGATVAARTTVQSVMKAA
jgi:hypothetical protein